MIVGCVPTATAMIIAYYDNEMANSLSSHDIGDYPLVANGKTDPEAKPLIQDFSSEMHAIKTFYQNGVTPG